MKWFTEGGALLHGGRISVSRLLLPNMVFKDQGEYNGAQSRSEWYRTDKYTWEQTYADEHSFPAHIFAKSFLGPKLNITVLICEQTLNWLRRLRF